MSVTDTNCHSTAKIDSRNAVSVRRIYNRRGEVMVEARLTNADASMCTCCGGDMGSGVVYRLSLSTHNWGGRPLNVCCEECAPDYIKRELREGSWRNGFTKQPCEACDRAVVLEKRRGRLYVFCSPHCQWTYHNTRVSNRTAADREKTCEVCDEAFTATRQDAKTCSTSCKQKAYRQRKKEAP